MEQQSCAEIDGQNFLLNINRRENPGAITRLETLIASGASPDEIARLCDELGHLRYADNRDPDALTSRYSFADPADSYTDAESRYSLSPYHTVLDRGYYEPTVRAIQSNRWLFARALENPDIVPPPTLRTHEDYMAYFESFRPRVLAGIIKSLTFIQPTKGCSGPCRNTCAVPVQGPPSAHIPFETLQYLFTRFHKQLASNGMISLYYANDLVDYKSGDKTGVDLIDLYRQHFGDNCLISLVFRLNRALVDFLFDAIARRGIPVHRLSRLVTGQKPDDFNRLSKKLQEKGDQEGIPWTAHHNMILREAFIHGHKTFSNFTMGNAVHPDTPESAISSKQITCGHGVILTTEGFQGVVVRPNSKVFPHGQLTFPLRAEDDGTMVIPQKTVIVGKRPPFLMDALFIPRPLFTRLDRSGRVVSRDEITEDEAASMDISSYKEKLSHLKGTFFVIDPAKNEKVSFAFLIQDLSREPGKQDFQLNKAASFLLKIKFSSFPQSLSGILQFSKRLKRRYKNNERALSEIAMCDDEFRELASGCATNLVALNSCLIANFLRLKSSFPESSEILGALVRMQSDLLEQQARPVAAH